MPKKVELYDDERKVVLNKMFEILNIDEKNNMFSLHKMDNDKEKQDLIIGLEDDIKKFFLCGEWTCFKKKNTVKRRWLSMIKYVVKDMGYTLESMQLKSNSNGLKYVDTMYCFSGNNKV